MPASADILAYLMNRGSAALNQFIPAAIGGPHGTVFSHDDPALARVHLPADIAVLLYAVCFVVNLWCLGFLRIGSGRDVAYAKHNRSGCT